MSPRWRAREEAVDTSEAFPGSWPGCRLPRTTTSTSPGGDARVLRGWGRGLPRPRRAFESDGPAAVFPRHAPRVALPTDGRLAPPLSPPARRQGRREARAAGQEGHEGSLLGCGEFSRLPARRPRRLGRAPMDRRARPRRGFVRLASAISSRAPGDLSARPFPPFSPSPLAPLAEAFPRQRCRDDGSGGMGESLRVSWEAFIKAGVVFPCALFGRSTGRGLTTPAAIMSACLPGDLVHRARDSSFFFTLVRSEADPCAIVKTIPGGGGDPFLSPPFPSPQSLSGSVPTSVFVASCTRSFAQRQASRRRRPLGQADHAV